MRKRVVILLLLYRIVLVVAAQTLLTGRVVIALSGKPLARVSVVAEDKGHRPIAYSLTKADGSFGITLAADKSYDALSFSLLGYANQRIRNEQFKNGMTIMMGEAPYQLKEIEVRAGRLRQLNDTLSYSVSGFRHHQDRSIADVIAKMPGLEVADNGVIKYQGKAINHFYIEGMGLMGKQYAMASENLNAMKVKEVQVLRNHQDIKSLQGVQFSDRAALNLILEDDAKGLWMGLVEAGLGSIIQKSDTDRLLRDGRLMSMMFGTQAQSLSMYKWNNTGKNIMDEVRNLIYDGRTTDDISSPTPNITFDTPNLAKQRYMMNNSRLLATNWLCKTGKEGNVRLQLSGYLDKTKGECSTQTIYSDALGGANIAELMLGEVNTSEWKGELGYKYNSSHLYVCNEAAGYMNFNNGWANTQINFISRKQEVRPHQFWLSDNLQIVKPLGGSHLLQFHGHLDYCYQPGTLLLTDMTIQHINQHTTEANTDLTFRHKFFRRLCVSVLAGFNFSRQKISVWRDETVRLSDCYSLLNNHIKPSIEVKTNSITWNTSVAIRLVNRYFKEISDVKFVAEPSSSVSYKISTCLQAIASYNHQWIPSSLTNMTAIPLFKNYRNCSIGPGNFLATGKHSGLFRLEYTDPVHGLFGYFNGLLSYQNNLPVYDCFLDGIVHHREAIGNYTDCHSSQIKGRVSKSLNSMKFLVMADVDLQRLYYSAMMQGHQEVFRNNCYQTGISFSLHPLTQL